MSPSETPKPVITGVTVSLNFGDKEWGNGSGSFMNLSSHYPDPGKSVEELGDVIDHGLDLYFSAWKTLLASRFAVGVISDKEVFKKHLLVASQRLAAVRKYLRKVSSEQPGQSG